MATLLPIALIAYVVGVFFTILATVYRYGPWRIISAVVLVSAWILHVGAVVHRGMIGGQMPLSNRGEYLLLLGLAITTLHLFVWLRWRVDAAGLILPPLATLCCFAAFGLLVREPVSSIPHPRGLFLFHTTVSTLGMATLCVALAMSLIYLVQDRALKQHRKLRLLERLPALDRCDRIGIQALWIGFLLLTVGIVAGVFVNEALYAKLWVLGLKQTLPIAAWLVFAAILVARLKVGFRGRKSAYLTITGVTLGLLTVVGMTL